MTLGNYYLVKYSCYPEEITIVYSLLVSAEQLVFPKLFHLYYLNKSSTFWLELTEASWIMKGRWNTENNFKGSLRGQFLLIWESFKMSSSQRETLPNHPPTHLSVTTFFSSFSFLFFTPEIIVYICLLVYLSISLF